MKIKTIQELNEKIWYRFLKIIYIFVFIVILIYSLGIIYENYDPKIDLKNSYIKCDDGRHLSYDYLKNNKRPIYLSEYLTSEDSRLIKALCAYNPSDPININPDNPADIKRLQPDYFNYDFIHKFTSRDWSKIIKYSILDILVIFAISEIIKRALYYVILGKIIPPKKNEGNNLG